MLTARTSRPSTLAVKPAVSDQLYRLAMGLIARLTPRPTNQGLVLCLHSISDEGADHPGDMAISTTFLERLITDLRRRHVDVLSLTDALSRLRAPPGQPFVCLTFDDGYRGVYTHAYPLLCRLSTPFALFITTDLIDRRMPLWWDALERLASAEDFINLPGRVVPTQTAQQKRAAITSLADDLRRRSPADRDARLCALSQLNLGLDLRAAYGRALTWPMLREMAASGLATVGAHTASHAFLAGLSSSEIAVEFEISRGRLLAELDLHTRFLAYPFGQPFEIGSDAGTEASAAGFDHAFTTMARPLISSDLARAHQLPRVLLSAKAQSTAVVHAYLTGVPAALASLRGG